MLRYTASILLLLALSAPARAETTECTEVTPPFTITAPGIYCLKRSFSISGSAVSIQSDDVVFDLNGHALVVTNPPFQVTAISSGKSNVTVRNGTVRGGHSGVALEGGAGNLVEGMRIEGAKHTGIEVSGTGHIVRNNLLIGVGVFWGGPVWGISATSGTGMRISGNHVVDTGVGVPHEVGAIRVMSAPGAVIEYNVVSNSAAPSSAFAQTGISVANFAFPAPGRENTKATVVGNRVVNMGGGIRNTPANSSGTTSVSLFLDNTVGGAVIPFSGGIMPANSNFSF
jgi:hypothetical protein